MQKAMQAERWTVKLVREPMEGWSMPSKISEPADIARFASAMLADEPAEVFVAFFLSTRYRVIGWHEVTRGIVDSSLVHAREAFRAAILANASAVIFVHNHPSGESSPSPEDRKITKMLKSAGETLGIRVLDHLVVTPDGFASATFGIRGEA